MGLMILLWLGFLVACGYWGAELGDRKGRRSEGMWLGFFGGPIGWIAISLQPATPTAERLAHLESDEVRCPPCQSWVAAAATTCPSCGSQLPTEERRAASRPKPTLRKR